MIIMSNFEEITGLLEKLNHDEFGTWIIDCDHKGTTDDPIHLPYPEYTEAVEDFITAVYEFGRNNPGYELNRYKELLEERGIRNIADVDYDTLDAQGAMALLTGVVRVERFFDGVILAHLKAGNIQKIIKRLKEISEAEDAMWKLVAKDFVERYPWTYAKTYADRAPHEYYVKKELDEKGQKNFVSFITVIRKHGFKAKFWGKEHTYLELDGRYYWTMGEPIEETTILNRCEASDYSVKDGVMAWKGTA